MKRFVGDCTDCLEDEWFRDNIASDATELAQIIDNSSPITREQFEADCGSYIAPLPNRQYGFNEKAGVMWAYDEGSDIHWFFY